RNRDHWDDYHDEL
ncbi:hypothetical protein CFC21_049114, partial [Triticum aestivum]